MFNYHNLFRQVWLKGIYCCQIIIHNSLKCESKNDIICEGLISLSTLYPFNFFWGKIHQKATLWVSLNCKCEFLRCRVRVPWQAQEEEVSHLYWLCSELSKSQWEPNRNYFHMNFLKLDLAPRFQNNLLSFLTLVLTLSIIVPKRAATVDGVSIPTIRAW